MKSLSILFMAVACSALGFYFKNEVKNFISKTKYELISLYNTVKHTGLSQIGSFSVDTAFVDGFHSNIMMLTQQRTARLWGKSRRESQSVEVDFFERLAPTDAEDIVDRHGDTPIMNSQHSKRQVTLLDADWGDLIDRMDRVRMLISPDSSYALSGTMALNRKKDDVFISAALGVARGGRKGEFNVLLPDTQKLVSIAENGTGATNLNVFTLSLISLKFDTADVDEGDEERRYLAFSGSQKQSLLRDNQAIDADYTNVKALVKGDIDEFFGFEFVRTQRLPVTAAITAYNPATGELGGASNLPAGARRCFAYLESGMLSSTGEDLIARISERDDKRYSTQVYVAHSVGAVRMEEVQLIEVICLEA